MRKLKFTMFGQQRSGRVVTHDADHVVVKSRNPYGTHNLCVVDRDSNEAFCVGNAASLGFAYQWMGKHALVRCLASV